MLKLKNLTCGYKDKIILKDINLDINQGAFAGIIGPNGSGKTTLLRAITKIIPIKKGNIYFENKNINELKFKQMAQNIAVVSQSYDISGITVQDFVLLGRLPYFKGLQFIEKKQDFEIVEECLELTGISDIKDRNINELSGGQKQLVYIAKALAQKPKLLILDEPTTSLDIMHQTVLMNLLADLNKKFGLTILMVIHDLNLASEYCKRLIMINKGEIYKKGVPKEILNSKAIEDVYKTKVLVNENPLSKKPYILTVVKSCEEF